MTQYSTALVINRVKPWRVLDTRFRGYDGVLSRDAMPHFSRGRRKILRLQFDRRTMRRAVGGVVPGIAIAMQGIGGRDAFRSDELFQRRKPMPVIGLAGVGIAASLRALDFIVKRRVTFSPGV